MKDKGWIKLDRGILDNWVWLGDPFSRGQAWVDLLLLANFHESTIRTRMGIRNVERGQIKTSRKELAARWKWSVSKVDRFLRDLTIQHMVYTSGTPDGTTLTLVNWAKYQGRADTNDTPNDTADETPTDTPTDTHPKNGKNVKNNKNNARARETTPRSGWVSTADKIAELMRMADEMEDDDE